MLRQLSFRIFFLLTAVSGCQTVPAPAPTLTSNPKDAFVRYWEERLAASADPRTWHQFCHAVESWRVLGKRDVRRLDAAMAAWPAELRIVPDRWRPLDEPVRLPVWSFVRKIEVNEDEVDALSGRLAHLDAVTHVEVHGPRALAAVGESAALPALAALRATKSDLPSLQRFIQKRGAKLEGLDVWENGLGDALGPLLASRNWPRLRRLDVGANGLGAEGASALGAVDAPQLGSLVVAFNPLGDEGLRAVLPPGRRLISFDARATTVGPAAATVLGGAGVDRLESLDLSDNALTDEGVTALAELPLTSLRSLRLNNVKMSAEGSTRLAAMIGGGLHVLELGRNNLGDAGVAPLCHRGMSGVRFLQLDANHLSNASLKTIATCAPLSHVQSLSLHNNSAFDLEGAKLLAMAPFTELTALGMDGCNLTDAALVELSRAGWWSRLTHLQLQGNQLTDNAVVAVFRSPPPRLQNLGLGWNELGAGATDAFAAAPFAHLQVLSLRGNPLDDSALRRLGESPWLSHLTKLDLRSIAYDGLSLSLDALAARLPDDAILQRDQ